MTYSIIHHMDGVYVRFTHNRKSKYKKLFTIEKKYFKNGRITSTVANEESLNEKIIEAHRVAQEYVRAVNGGKADSQILTEHFSNNVTLCELIRKYAVDMAGDSMHDSQRKYRNIADIVENYGDKKVKHIQPDYWNHFLKYLRKQEYATGTIARYIGMVRTVINANPNLSIDKTIHTFRLSRASRPKEILTENEFQKILNKEIYDKKLELIKDVFIVQVMTNGTRISDVLQFKKENIQGEYLEFVEQKNQRLKRVKILPRLAKIFEKYSDISKDYLMPVLTQKPANPRKSIGFNNHIKNKTEGINKGLKTVAALCGIEKRVSTKFARDSFASWANDSGLDLTEIQYMVNHASKRTTETYIQSIGKQNKVDSGAFAVLSNFIS